jgi:hypothetical protein
MRGSTAGQWLIVKGPHPNAFSTASNVAVLISDTHGAAIRQPGACLVPS